MIEDAINMLRDQATSAPQVTDEDGDVIPGVTCVAAVDDSHTGHSHLVVVGAGYRVAGLLAEIFAHAGPRLLTDVLGMLPAAVAKREAEAQAKHDAERN